LLADGLAGRVNRLGNLDPWGQVSPQDDVVIEAAKLSSS